LSASAAETVAVDFQPIGRRGHVKKDMTILDAARQLGVGLSSVCGGNGTCGTCKVRVQAGNVSPVTTVELELLSDEQDELRLGCQTELRGDATIHIPPESLTAPQRTQVEGRHVPIAPDPAVVAFELRLSPPTLVDLRSDAARLRAALPFPAASVDHRALESASLQLREHNWTVCTAVRDREIIAILPERTPLLGVAVDLGTTKVAGYLIDLTSGTTLAVRGAMNPQIAFGEDVMARIAMAMGEGDGRTRLHQSILVGLNSLIADLCAQIAANSQVVTDVVVVGNTAMHHLFLGLPVGQLGTAPYVPAESAAIDVKARDIGLEVAPGAYVHLLPNIAGFVGADHVAALLASRLDDASDHALLLDIGTNTEISLASRGRIVSCSCASGPAFEGAHIKFGMRAAPGAIERVQIHNQVVMYQTIDNLPPVGICGSGILDTVAEMKRVGILDVYGKMHSIPGMQRMPRKNEFVIAPAEETGISSDIVLRREDVNEIQLAKGAIAAGWNVLLTEAGLREAEIDRVLVAGAFGTYLDLRNAIRIGMLPHLPLSSIQQMGNAAGMGATMALVSKQERARAAEISRRVEYVELTTHPSFPDLFMAAMLL
jgi:uncharacterized 2Fe-2S/4Fe-4S cluster protein (DUF4445 family)